MAQWAAGEVVGEVVGGDAVENDLRGRRQGAQRDGHIGRARAAGAADGRGDGPAAIGQLDVLPAGLDRQVIVAADGLESEIARDIERRGDAEQPPFLQRLDVQGTPRRKRVPPLAPYLRILRVKKPAKQPKFGRMIYSFRITERFSPHR